MSAGPEVPSLKVMTLKNEIPDKSIVTSQLSLRAQRLAIDYAKFQDYFDWIKKQPIDQVITKGALLTMNNLPSDHHEQWDNVSVQDHLYSLEECIKEKMCTCFHRSVFYNTLMNQRGVDCVTLEGKVVETDKEILHPDPKITPLLTGEALGIHPEKDFEDAHLWNITLENGKYYLVDTSFLINDAPVIQEIEFDNEGRNTFTIKLPDGRYRHYCSMGPVTVSSSI